MALIWHYSDYQKYLIQWADSQKKRSGQLQTMASFLGVHPSRLTRILKGFDHPTLEQAFLMAQFLSLNELESQYFMELVNLARSSNSLYKNHTKTKLGLLKLQFEAPAEMHSPDKPLTESQERTYYSSYQYGAVWLQSMVSSKNDLLSIAQILRIDLKTVTKISEFLVKTGLCVFENDRLLPGPRLLTVSSSSPQIENFLSNWRLQSVNSIPERKKGSFFYSEPMALGGEAADKIRELLDKTILEIRQIMQKYPAENVKCLNIDFFDV